MDATNSTATQMDLRSALVANSAHGHVLQMQSLLKVEITHLETNSHLVNVTVRSTKSTIFVVFSAVSALKRAQLVRSQ
jgi:hypothetical protein